MPTSFENELGNPTEATTIGVDSSFEEQLPLSFAQQRVWFFSKLDRNSALYNIPTALRLKGILDCTALEKSFNTILQRHEALRTNFISKQGQPFQTIRANAKILLGVLDFTNLAADVREKQAETFLNSEAQKPFDLARDLLIRASLIRLDAREHILFLNLHHIVFDEWSLRVFFQELTALYKTFVESGEPDLLELPIQYADFALWQRDCLHGEILEREVAYWKKQLGDNFSTVELPLDHVRPAIQTYRGAIHTLSLPKNISSSIGELSRREGATLFMTLLAAFQTLLHRWTSQEQITVGSPISGRNKIETESLIGFFVNTLVLRTDVSDEISFRELLSRVREVTLGAYAHQELPFEKLVAELQPKRQAANLSFIQVMFALQNSSENDLALPGIESEPIELDSKTAKFDFTFVVRETDAGLKLIAEYNTDLFENETVERLLKLYGHLLQSIVDNPEQKISHLNLLNGSEKRKFLFDWNQTQTDFPREQCVHDLFKTQAEKTPEAVAVIFGDQQLTYRELDERSNQLANHLRKLGVGPDVLVGICLERSLDLIVGFLGILKAGGAYVPLDLDYPPERLAFMIADAQCPVLLTHARFASRPGAMESKVICLDSDWPSIAKEKKTAPDDQTNSDNLAYVIYTSGSTGHPKGVAVPHRAIARLILNTNYIQLDSSDRIAQASNSSFDAATFEIWGALLHGGTLVGFSKELLLSPRDFAAQLSEQKITVLFLTTALFNQIVADAPHAFRAVKNVLFGGEAVDPKSVLKILKADPPERLLHVYGPTECTTFASWFEINDVSENAATIPIGEPLSNTQFFVLDRYLQPVPMGWPGELHLGGDGLARGYLNRPDLTAAKFIANPFAAESVLYKTGDLVRYLPDGNIEFVGRIDDQVKIRGFRIELSEIEIGLRQHPGVKDALVLVREENGDKRLVGYLIDAKHSTPNPSELRQFLKRKLPDYMVPSVFVALENFPLTQNGKIDRGKLPAPETIQLPNSKSHRSLNDLEKRLQQIWENVLGRKPIDVCENFFDLGGHSLLAVRLFAQIEKALGKKLPLSLLFQSPTIEQLAEVISENTFSQTESSLVEIQPKGSRPPMFWLHTLGGGGGGGVLRYQKLAQLLGPDQPSYGLVAPQIPFTKIEEMATHYLNEMRKVQPDGPYHLGGYCFGGVIALEMAQQLRAAGEEVALLAMLDTSPPNVVPTRRFWANLRSFFASFAHHASRLRQQEPAQIYAAVKRKSKKVERILSTFLGRDSANRMQNEIQLEDVIDMSHYPKGYEHFAKVHWKALLDYFPKPYDGKVLLLESAESPGHLRVEQIWKTLAENGLQIKKLPCRHETMLDEPNVQLLANELKARLQHQDDEEAKSCAARN